LNIYGVIILNYMRMNVRLMQIFLLQEIQ